MMPKRGANLETRLDRLTSVVADLPDPNRCDVVQAVAVDKAGGRAPGLYPVGSRGSTAGVLNYDPADGEPQVHAGRMSPWGLLIVCEDATLDTII